MAALSLNLSIQKLSSPHIPNHTGFGFRFGFRHRRRGSRISAAMRRIPSTPPTAPPGELYQPFRPPPSPLPSKYRSLDPSQLFDILRNRLGLWHEYAPLISSLVRDGFTPPSIEEITGITSIQQNSFQVASQVRDSLLSSSFPPDYLSFYDASSGAELLYELRLLNAAQRVAAAMHVADRRLDPKDAQELARAIKDFPRRRGEVGWNDFSAASPGDCLAYTDFRLSREVVRGGNWMEVLEKAMEEAETESARKRIEEEMERRRRGEDKEGGEMENEEGSAATTVPVVRLRYGEVAEATSVVLLPVCKAEEGVDGVPEFCRVEDGMGVVEADKGWRRWVVLPRWGPVAAVGEKGGVAVEFGDGRMLPWRRNRWEKEEGVIVVVDRKRNKVEEEVDELYLVRDLEDEGKKKKKKGVMVERGRKILELGKGKMEALAVVVMVVRPPKEEEDDQLKDEDWE